MTTYEAPAKLNLALHVRSPRPDGYHPLESLVQTVEWLDTLSLIEGEDRDSLQVEGLEVPEEGNLVLAALAKVRMSAKLPPQTVILGKTIPLGAGMGGGSSDAAAALVAAGELVGLTSPEELAAGIGADVPLFFTGGTLLMRGVGERIESLRPLSGFGIAVVVPEFQLATAEVYERWDRMEGPQGEAMPIALAPPSLRDGIPLRNDLTAAAVDVEPRLGDFMADLRAAWGVPVLMTGSGSACFGFFSSRSEADHAANSAPGPVTAARGVELRPHGVARAAESPAD